MVLDTLERRINIKDLVLEEPKKRTSLPYDIRDCIAPDHLRWLENLPPANKFDIIDNLQRGLLILFPDRFPVKSVNRNNLLKTFKRLLNPAPGERNDIVYAPHTLNKKRLAANMKFLFPDTDLIDAEEWERLHSMFTASNVRNFQGGVEGAFVLDIFFRSASYIQMISPQKAKEFNLDEDRIWKEGLKQLEFERNRQKYGYFLELAFYMKVLNPERMRNFEITSEDWVGMRKHFV